MRRAFVTLHRLIGLTLALFLLIAGVTGAIIAWDHELDGWLNPELFYAADGPRPYTPLELADKYEQSDSRLAVRFMPLEFEPGHALQLSIAPRIDPKTGAPYDLGFDQVALDPGTGEVRGMREWGKVAVDRTHLLPFLYRLHYSLHLPLFGEFDSGVFLMGLLAIAWVLDCFIALVIAFPSGKVWKRSFKFRWTQGFRKLNFDLHRSGGVWLWLLTLILSITAVSMNLGDEVMRPIVSVFSTLEADPFDGDHLSIAQQQIPPRLDRRAAIAHATEHARAQGIDAPAGGIFYDPEHGMYGVGFFEPGDSHADGKLGNPWIYLDPNDGSLRKADIPGSGSAGDVFMQLQFPLHSGRLFGVVGRTIISVLGVLVAMLSVTGVVIWARRRRSREIAREAVAGAAV